MTRLPAFDYVQGGAIADFLLVHPDQAEIANAELPLNPHSAVGCQVCDLPVPGVRRRPRSASIVMVPHAIFAFDTQRPLTEFAVVLRRHPRRGNLLGLVQTHPCCRRNYAAASQRARPIEQSLPCRAGRRSASDTGILGAGMVRDFTQRGYVVDGNIVFERYAAQGKLDRLPRFIDELVAKHVDVIVTEGYRAAIAAKERAGNTAIVVTRSGDPVATGLVASLAHPGGNITGVSDIAGELSAKRLALLKEAVPSVRIVAVLWNADDLGMTLRYRAAEAEAPRLGMSIVPLGVRAPNDFDAAFSEMTKNPPDAILMITDVLTTLNRKRVIQYAEEHRLPAIYEYASLAYDGGLMAYGPDVDAILDRAAGLADRILKGAKPADLPLELPTHFQFAINLKTAKAIGLTIPEAILLRADDVIE